MERKKMAFAFTTLSADELVAAVMRAAPERVTQPPCRFDLEVAQNCPAVCGDRDALVTVVLNLLDNAYKYSNDPRHISLRLCGQQGQLHLEVRDNGIGLSRRSARRVFRRFFQADRSLSRSVGGCGLGLSIVKFVVDAHSGTVGVSSRPGQGSTFTVTLPGLESGARRRGNEG
jgi:signal transduction histidine kinase